MKRFLLLLVPLLAAGQTANIATMTATTASVQTNRIGVAAGGAAAFSDDFNRADNDSLGANWTEADADVDISSNTVLFRDGSFATMFAVHNTSCGSTTQYVQFEITPTYGGYPQAVLRYTDAATEFYYVELSGTEATWYHMSQIGGTATAIGSPQSYSASSGTIVSITITGTGDDTVIRCWNDAAQGTLPVDATNWNGDTTPTATFTDNPGNPVDAGNYVGLGCQQSSADGTALDDFYGGGL